MLNELKDFLPYLFTIIGAFFSFAFMIIVLFILLRALQSNKISTLFQEPDGKSLSTTKFWQNIAYCAATFAFLSINIVDKGANFPIEIIWTIYLGVVASNAVLSKWISAKYQDSGTKTDTEQK